MPTAIAGNSRTTFDQYEYERRYADFTERYNDIKVEYDKISEQLENKKAEKIIQGIHQGIEKTGCFGRRIWWGTLEQTYAGSGGKG